MTSDVVKIPPSNLKNETQPELVYKVRSLMI